jgi:glycosyltransferase involved in cell wall biosynthesis
MTLGLPIITLNWGGPGEMVHTETAVIIEVKSPTQVINDIHAGLIRLATNPHEAQKLGQAAHNHALEKFRWNMKWKIVNGLYSDLIEQDSQLVRSHS